MHLKTLLGVLIGVLNLVGFCFTLVAFVAVIIIAKTPRSSSIYIMAATNLTVDLIQLLLGLLYLSPSIIYETFFFPGGRQDPAVVALGSTFLFCWYYGSVAQILVALNRLVVVCFPYYDIFTPKRVLIMMVCLYPVAMSVTLLSQYILPCCNFSFNHVVLSYTYNELPDIPNYSNMYIDMWLNSTSSASCLAIYAIIILFVRKMNKVSQNALNEQQKQKRRMKEYKYALQFSAISLFYLFSWVFFRVFPLFMKDDDSLNWYSVIAICVTVNSSANAIVYLISNQEVVSVVKNRFVHRGSSIHALGSTAGRDSHNLSKGPPTPQPNKSS